MSSDDEGSAEVDRDAFDHPSAAQQEVRELLRAAAARDLTMPDDVVARLDAALAAAQPVSGVASLDRRRQRARRWNRVLAAAAGVVVLGGGALLVQRVDLPDGAGSASSGAAAGGGTEQEDATASATPVDPPVLSTGTDYGDAAALRAGAAVVAAAGAPAATADGGRTLLSSPQDAAGEDRGDPAVAQALSCAQAAGVDPAAVVGVDLAQWRGTPAAVVVATSGPGTVRVTVLPRDCVPGAAPLTSQTVPSPTP